MRKKGLSLNMDVYQCSVDRWRNDKSLSIGGEAAEIAIFPVSD